jgi:hypothetical protein
MFEKECDESQYRDKLEEQRVFLSDMFLKLSKGDVCEPIEYNLTDDIWYRVSVKMVGLRADTCIMMATFMDISDYKQDY